MRKDRPKIKFFTRSKIYLKCITAGSKEIVNPPSKVPDFPKEGKYYILVNGKWVCYVFFNSKWYDCGEASFDYSDIEPMGLLPNLSEKEWDAIKKVGHKRLNKYWRKMLEAKLFEDWWRYHKIRDFKRLKKNK